MSEKKPVHKVSFYPVSAAIWRNEGERGAFYSVTFQRSYKKDGKYQSSESFNVSDLLTLAKVADQAHTKIEELRAADKDAEQPE